jgi:uncharacterized membrane protein YccF (DUF307 family)
LATATSAEAKGCIKGALVGGTAGHFAGHHWTARSGGRLFYTLLPFGQKAVSRADYSGHEDVGTGPLGVLGNIVWLVLAGWWLALGHIIVAVFLAVTIIGIPFAWAHFKLAGIALWPIGKTIVPRQSVSNPARVAPP